MTSGDADGKPRGHVFLSYVREDKAPVDRLQAMFEAAGVTVWRDTESLWPGADWRLEIRRAITSGSFAFVACFSEHTSAREVSYQNEELALAVDQMRQRAPGRAWLLPVRFTDCMMPEYDLGGGRTLSSLQRVDLFNDRWEAGAARLLATVIRILESVAPTSKPVTTGLRLADEVKRLLPTPPPQIELEDLVRRVGASVRDAIQDPSTCPPPEQPLRGDVAGFRFLASQVTTYARLAQPIVEILIPGCTWGLPEQWPIWTRVIQDVANADTATGTPLANLRRLPALVALYAGGLAAVHRRQFGNFRAIAVDALYRGTNAPPLPLAGAITPSTTFERTEFATNLLLLEDPNPLSDEEIGLYLAGRKGRRFTPVSDWLSTWLRPAFADLIGHDDEYNETFDALEVLLGIVATDLRDNLPRGYVYPSLGSFTWRSTRWETRPWEEVLKRFETEGESAPEVKAGLFAGSAERAITAATAFSQIAASVASQRAF